jgi:tRNA 2-thiouridine synthesizing protein A
VKIGQVIEIKSNDKGSRKDIAAWSKKMGHDYLGLVEADGHDRLFVCRKK